jgi:hypothetical protein
MGATSGGLKFLAFDKKLNVDFGYIRYSYPGTPAELGYDYGEINLNVGYDFGLATLAGRVAADSSAALPSLQREYFI